MFGRTNLRAAAICCLFGMQSARAADSPFLITYTHQLEEPGNLEVALKSASARLDPAGRFYAANLELEYGLKGWWTTEVYLDGQITSHESTIFTGYRWENRFRVLTREHRINPVLYLEFENIDGADKTLLEVVGHDGKDDLTAPNALARMEKKREVEGKLILSSHVRNWTIAGNFTIEKNVGHAPFEFGYAVGVSRPLGLWARSEPCVFCPENLQAGVEMYGGLGTSQGFGLAETSHYVAPVITWTAPVGVTLSFEPGFGITQQSAGLILRLGVSYEFAQVGRHARALLTSFGGTQ